jgi:DnaJ-class molecular chaperone
MMTTPGLAQSPQRNTGDADKRRSMACQRRIKRAEDDVMDEPKLIPCPECGGTGKVPLPLDNLPGPTPPIEIDCPTCGGTGLVRDPIPDPPS